jgi:hypothetical protein
MAFKRASTVTDDREQAKKEHRLNLKGLMDKYFEDVSKGKADGIRTAKELAEIVKLDLLLMGEATERTDNTNPVDEAQVLRIQQSLDMDTPEAKSLMKTMYKALNIANDDLDSGDIQMELSEDTPEGIDRSELFGEDLQADNPNKTE